MKVNMREIKVTMVEINWQILNQCRAGNGITHQVLCYSASPAEEHNKKAAEKKNATQLCTHPGFVCLFLVFILSHYFVLFKHKLGLNTLQVIWDRRHWHHWSKIVCLIKMKLPCNFCKHNLACAHNLTAVGSHLDPPCLLTGEQLCAKVHSALAIKSSAKWKENE